MLARCAVEIYLEFNTLIDCLLTILPVVLGYSNIYLSLTLRTYISADCGDENYSVIYLVSS